MGSFLYLLKIAYVLSTFARCKAPPQSLIPIFILKNPTMKKNLSTDFFPQGTPSDMTSKIIVSIAEVILRTSTSSLIFIFPQLNYEGQPILRE